MMTGSLRRRFAALGARVRACRRPALGGRFRDARRVDPPTLARLGRARRQAALTLRHGGSTTPGLVHSDGDPVPCPPLRFAFALPWGDGRDVAIGERREGNT